MNDERQNETHRTRRGVGLARVGTTRKISLKKQAHILLPPPYRVLTQLRVARNDPTLPQNPLCFSSPVINELLFPGPPAYFPSS